jgi:aspartyl-tRNA(Asn)/glutamyl-tRNA(Gln) amidotransferase subunit B
MRSKEEAHDYRYFPDPDLVPVIIDSAWVEEIRRSLPEMPDKRRRRYVAELGLPEYDAAVITASPAMAGFFEEAAAACQDAKAVSNWLMGDVTKHLKEMGLEICESKLTPSHLAELLKLQNDGTISVTMAKTVLEEIFTTGKRAGEIVSEKGLFQISDQEALRAIVDQVVAENPKSVDDYKGGKEKALGFLVGQVMRLSKGKANPELVNALLRDRLG